MRATVNWVEKISFPDNGDNCVYDLCFSPDGAQMVAACGLRILVINVAEGTIIQALKGHKNAVYCVSYAFDGKRFASGGADKTVIIWTNSLQGTLKYVHGDSIQCLAYNPQSHLLASCSVNDFGLWSPEKKSVDKQKVSAKINACAWTNDGLFLALGLANGSVTIRTKTGIEHIRIERPGGSQSPIWGVCWCKNPDDLDQDMLCLADWTQHLSFYNLHGKQIMKDRAINFDPLRIISAKIHRDTEYLIVTGANKACGIYTTEGIRCTSLGEQDSWVWVSCMKPNSSNIAIGTQGGVITYYELQFLVVHALYKSVYAHRLNMTDVAVQNLLEDVRIRIKCRDVVKKLAIFKESLAIQFADRVLIYQRDTSSEEFKYTLKEKINQAFDCSLLVMCSENLILCQEKKLLCYNFSGVKQREWILESPIRYIRSLSGMEGNEVLIAGLKNGLVVKIFLGNPFPAIVVKVRQSVRCIDLNQLHTKIAIVDESATLFVFDLTTKEPELLYEEPKAISVFWNTSCEDLLSFSGFGVLNIKANGFPIHQQKMAGFVVGFCGSKIFSMQNSTVVTMEVPLSAPMYQYLQNKMYKEAYKVASLGVPYNDWEALAFEALEGLEFDIAKKALAKTKKIVFLRLLDSFEKTYGGGRVDKKANMILLADIFAHIGRYNEAAKVYREFGEEHRAMSMYADLGLFDLAQEYMGGGDSVELMKVKAEWATKINEPRKAAEMFFLAGEKIKAIELMGENSWVDMLLDVSRKLDRGDVEALNSCAEQLERLGQVSAAAEMYRRVGHLEKLIDLYVIGKEWQEAFFLAEKHPELKKFVYLPYAQWLIETDQFAEAQKAFHEAGCPEEAFKVLEQLRKNAIAEKRFHDASYFHWVLSMQYLELANKDPENEKNHLEIFSKHQNKASIFYAYNSISRYTDQPFTPFMPDALFNIARFILHEHLTIIDPDISRFQVTYTLAKQARKLGAFKLARNAFEHLLNLRIPDEIRDGLDLMILEAKGDNYSDAEETLSHCYRCSATNPLMSNKGNCCINCNHPFVFSFISFEVLPLVEFKLEEGISDEEALGLIGSKFPSEAEIKSERGGSANSSSHQWKETENEDVQILQFNDEYEMDGMSADKNDPFSTKTITIHEGQVGFPPIVLSRKSLRILEPSEIIICKWPKPLRYKFYKNLLPGTSISQCHVCFKLFYTDDFMLQVLQRGHCPFCRSPPYETRQSNEYKNINGLDD